MVGRTQVRLPSLNRRKPIAAEAADHGRLGDTQPLGDLPRGGPLVVSAGGVRVSPMTIVQASSWSALGQHH